MSRDIALSPWRSRIVAARWHAHDIAERQPTEARLRVAAQFFATIAEPILVTEIATEPDPHRCPNCDAPSLDRIFCTELCSQEAAFVRYVRRLIAQTTSPTLGILRDAIGTRVLMLRAGGYPTRERMIPTALRSAVLARDGGRCQLCGAIGNEIDHIASSSSDLSNLRVTCKDCNGQRVSKATVVATDAETVARIRAQDSRLMQRIAAANPLRVCDDEAAWTSRWRTFKRPASSTPASS